MSSLANQAAFNVSELAKTLMAGYFTRAATIEIINHPRVKEFLPGILPGQAVRIGIINSKVGGDCQYDFPYRLDLLKTNPLIGSEFARLWAYGSSMRLETNFQDFGC